MTNLTLRPPAPPPAGLRSSAPRATAEAAPAAPARSIPARGRYRRQALRRSLTSGALTITAWVLITVPVAIWLGQGGARAMVSSVPEMFTQLGIACGLAATATCLLMLLLAARIPVVDAAIGHDRALATHRSLGFWTVLGLFNHAIFLISGSALVLRSSWWAEFVDEMGVGDLLLAAIGLGTFVLVGISSATAARKRLGYEVWFVIHLLSYAAVILSLPHQFSQGLFAQPGILRWYWLGFVGLTFFLLLAFRVLLPLLNSLTQSVRVAAVEPAGPDAVSITLTGRHIAGLGTRAGQFFHWRFWAPGLWCHQHPFSVSARTTSDSLRITVRDLGAGSAALQRVRPGTRVSIQGPYGLFSDAARTTTDGVVLIGAGIGIAPIRALLEETDIAPGAATVILRASTPDELYLVDEIADLCRRRGAALHVAVGPRATDGVTPGWLPGSWRGASLARLAPHAPVSDVFICGPTPWTQAVIADARAAGVPTHRIHDERFSW